MPVGDYVAGLAFFAGTWGGAAYVTAVVARRRLPMLDPAPRALAVGLVFLGALIAVHILPGMLGILSREAVTATALAAALLASRLPRIPSAAEPSPTPPPTRETDRLSSTMAAAAVVLVAISTL